MKSTVVGEVLLPGSVQLSLKCSKRVLKISIAATAYRVCSQPSVLTRDDQRGPHLASCS